MISTTGVTNAASIQNLWSGEKLTVKVGDYQGELISIELGEILTYRRGVARDNQQVKVVIETASGEREMNVSSYYPMRVLEV